MYFDEPLFSRGLDVISRRKEGLFAGKLEQRNCRGMYSISELHECQLSCALGLHTPYSHADGTNYQDLLELI
ncbi:hypothetical protein WG66_008831 [Moniliophthora roreri]|nr:hypothetical protein WG66_008831 [Moniliophthora roreri]